MLEILTDKSVCEHEDFLFDVNSIFVDIEIKDTKFNREIIKTIDGGTFLSGTHFLDKFGAKIPLNFISTTSKILLGVQYESRVVNGMELGINGGNLLIREPRGRIYLPANMLKYYDYGMDNTKMDVLIDGQRFYSYYDYFDYIEEVY